MKGLITVIIFQVVVDWIIIVQIKWNFTRVSVRLLITDGKTKSWRVYGGRLRYSVIYVRVLEVFDQLKVPYFARFLQAAYF